MTFETAVLPSSPRAIATTSTRSFLWNFAGSRNARNGGDVSTAKRCQVEPRRTANATLTGAVPATVAEEAQRFDSVSPTRASFGGDGGAVQPALVPDVDPVGAERAEALRREREVERPGHGEERHARTVLRELLAVAGQLTEPGGRLVERRVAAGVAG